MLRIAQLTQSDVQTGPTRVKLGNLLELHDRRMLASVWKLTEHNPYQTKYWPFPMLLAVCENRDILPVLTQTGKDRIRREGNRIRGVKTVWDHEGTARGETSDPLDTMPASEVEPEPVQEEEVVQAKPEVAMAINEAITPKQETTVADPRAALLVLIEEALERRRMKDGEEVKNLIANVAASSAGAAVEVVLSGKADAALGEVRRMVEEHLATVDEKIERTRKVVHAVKINDREEISLDGHVHEAFDEALELLTVGEEVALIGPTGSGKTHMWAQLGKAMGREYAVQSCSGGMSESKIIGGWMPTGEGGRFEPFWTDFLKLYRDGGNFLADEWDAADENVALVINGALANGYIDVMGLGRINRNAEFSMGVSMNTFGTGANRMYVGRNQLDEATLDRFRIGQIEMDYDRKLEQALISAMNGSEEWLTRCWQIRDAINRDAALRRNMSTRFILKGAKLQAMAGWSTERCLKKFVMGWPKSDKDKVGLGSF